MQWCKLFENLAYLNQHFNNCGSWNALITPFKLYATTIVRFFIYKLVYIYIFGGGASDMARDSHCATCQELVFLKLYLDFFSNTSCFYFNLEIILNRFGRYGNAPSANLKKLTIISHIFMIEKHFFEKFVWKRLISFKYILLNIESMQFC